MSDLSKPFSSVGTVTNRPIFDLHCDLLLYLSSDSKRTIYDEQSNCSISHLKAGNVAIQTMAIFASTCDGSSQMGLDQSRIFSELSGVHAQYFQVVGTEQSSDNKVQVLAAIENASAFCEESESLDHGFSRLEQIIETAGPILYISLTWNGENRFGGGDETCLGLKEDGRSLLSYLSGRGIAIDLSHASSSLATDTVDFIEKEDLDLRLLTSHSAFYGVHQLERNLREDIAKRIIASSGLLGLNLVQRHNGGAEASSFLAQLDYALSLGAEDSICLGADFFSDLDMPQRYKDMPDYYPVYINGCENASCYPELLQLIKNELKLSDLVLDKLCYKNAQRFLQSIWDINAEKSAC